MRKGLALVVVLSVCLTLALTPVLADRTSRSADRTKSSTRGVAASEQDSVSIHPVVQRSQLQFREGSADASVNTRAESYMAMAAAAGDDQIAISYLTQAVNLGTQAGNEKLLTEAYLQLGDLYEGTASKQVNFYLSALQTTSEPALRAELQSRITRLGGDVFDFAALPSVGTSAATQDAGPDDTCDGAESVTIPWDEVMSITPSGDHNWRSFEVPAGVSGWIVTIETVSDDIFGDDTDLRLYGGCDAGTPTDFLEFNDDGGAGYLSLITSDCLEPGTYYVEVGGYGNSATPSDFHFTVDWAADCINPSYPEEPDGYEPDDDRSEAAEIGNPTSTPPHSNGWGRVHQELQDHAIYPAGDWDHVDFEVNRSELVRMGVATEFPTFFNDFSSMPIGTLYDSYIELLYGVEPDYGGFCNEQDASSRFRPYCRSAADCPEPINPIPGYPACIPLYYFTFGGVQYWWPENPLAWNEDKSYADWGSELLVCLPRSDQQTPSLTADGNWILRVMSSPYYDPEGIFFYQVQVRNEVQCNFELEPNNGPFDANPIELGQTYHGFQELSEFFGTQGVYGGDWFSTDPDWHSFDVETESLVTFETDGFDSYACDTFLQMYVGPSDTGTYYILSNLADDDGGPGYLSALAAILPPADELLGNTVVDANYFLDVTTGYPVTDFPWVLYTSVEPYAPPSFDEVEPNDTCDIGNEALLGDTLTASIDPACDYDAFNLSLTESRYVVFETDGGDTTIKLTNSAGDYLGCDDDGNGLASRIEGCLPADDYCLRVRAYSSSGTIAEYDMNVMDMGPCVPTDPPSTIYDELYRCDNAQEPNEFDNCPNVLGD